MQPSKAIHQVKQKEFSPVICYANALQAAAVRGSKEMVATLIENGARPHLVAGYYGDALQAACLKGHKEVVSMLLNDHDFDPNTQGGYMETLYKQRHQVLTSRLSTICSMIQTFAN